ncbi:MAG: ABC transporter substrate-binding protein, partial [Lentisphaerae bacterium]|nr:ABC transporter substrate-binding protein [Lentisphaerota bacterium]
MTGICGTAYSGDADPIKLVVCEALSGKFQDIGERYLDGAKYAVQEINSQGGLLGRKVEIIPIDNALNPDVAVQKV